MGKLAGYQLAVFVCSRLQGEARLLDRNETAAEPEPLNQVLVKKLDKEFLVRFDDVQWLEANGNYVNLHSDGRLYPLRSTLARMETQLADQGFVRIHRRYILNRSAIDQLAYQPSGDGEVTLKDGSVLPISRRYRENLRQALEPGDRLG